VPPHQYAIGVEIAQNSDFVSHSIRLVENVDEHPPILMADLVDQCEEFFVQLDDQGAEIFYQRIDLTPISFLGDSMSDLFFAKTEKTLSQLKDNMDDNFSFFSKTTATTCPKSYTDSAYSAVNPAMLNQILTSRDIFPKTLLCTPVDSVIPSYVDKIFGKTKTITSNAKWSGPDPFAIPWKSTDTYFIHAPILELDRYLHKIRASSTPRVILVTPYEEKHWRTLQILLCMSFGDPIRIPHGPTTFTSGITPNWKCTGLFFLTGDHSIAKLFQSQSIPQIQNFLFHTNDAYLSNPPTLSPKCVSHPTSFFSSLGEALKAGWKEVMGSVYSDPIWPTPSSFDPEQLINKNSLAARTRKPAWGYGNIGTFRLQMIIDTGAGMSLISRSSAECFQKFPTQFASVPVTFQGIGGKKNSSEYKELPIDLWATKGKTLSFTAMFFIVDHPGHLLLSANDILGPLKWVQVIQLQPDPSFGQSLYMLDVFVPISIEKEMKIGDISKQFLSKFDPLPSAINLVSELYHSCFLTISNNVAVLSNSYDHPPKFLSMNQIDCLVKRFDLGDLSMPYDTPPAFEDAIANATKLVNLKEDKLTVFLALRIMRRFYKAFAYPGNDLGCYNGGKYVESLKFPFPSQPPPRRCNPVHREFLHSLETKWTSPTVLFEPCPDSNAYLHELVVINKAGKSREVVDYSPTNPFLNVDDYQFTTMMDVLHYQLSQKLVGCSVTDMNSMYNQIVVDPDSRKLMAVRHPITGKAFQPVRLPLGPTPAPRFAQRALDETLGKLKFTATAPYMDDVSATQPTMFLHFDALGHWWGALESRGWTQSIAKSHLLVSSLVTLGYQQDQNGNGPAPEKIEAIMNLAPPKTILELWQFWGLMVFYKDGIPNLMTNYSIFLDLINEAVAKYHLSVKTKEVFKKPPLVKIFDQVEIPIVNLPTSTSSINSSIIPEQRPMIRKKDRNLKKFVEKIAIQQTNEYLTCFDSAKKVLTNSSFLANLRNPWEYALSIHIDSSYTAVGCVIMQVQPDMTTRPIAFSSKRCSSADQILWATQLEATGIANRLDYHKKLLQGDFPFANVGDNAALKWILSYSGENRGQRVASFILNQYRDRMAMIHFQGDFHIPPDVLSRLFQLPEFSVKSQVLLLYDSILDDVVLPTILPSANAVFLSKIQPLLNPSEYVEMNWCFHSLFTHNVLTLSNSEFLQSDLVSPDIRAIFEKNATDTPDDKLDALWDKFIAEGAGTIETPPELVTCHIPLLDRIRQSTTVDLIIDSPSAAAALLIFKSGKNSAHFSDEEKELWLGGNIWMKFFSSKFHKQKVSAFLFPQPLFATR
jgi:hypothetical protein